MSLYLEITSVQKQPPGQYVCGDIVDWMRTPSSTIALVCDGMGKGVNANLSAQLSVSRLMNLLKEGFSLRHAFHSILSDLQRNRGSDLPFCVITIAQVLNNGEATILSYEMADPLLISFRRAHTLPMCLVESHAFPYKEWYGQLSEGDTLLLYSDGVTEAGLGREYIKGIGAEGVEQFAADYLEKHNALQDLPQALITKSLDLSPSEEWDDTTVLMISCRICHTVNIFTGPPTLKRKDKGVVQRFINRDGIKVVCGADTSSIVARELKTDVQISALSESLISPPEYEIEGIDLATEGAITLNQAARLLESPLSELDPDSCVTKLVKLLKHADRINFIVGQTQNQAHDNIAFLQTGILERQEVVRQLTAQLRQQNKLVVIDYC